MKKLTGIDWAILVSSIGFVFILFISAVWQADIRWLHAFQALMYVTVIVLGLRHNRWGYFIGISIAGLWNYVNLFVTTFFQGGMHQLQLLLTTGQLHRPDLVIAVFAVLFHFVLIYACVLGYLRLEQRYASDLPKLLLSFAVSTGYFAAIIAVFQPRYLELFSHMLHPHGL